MNSKPLTSNTENDVSDMLLNVQDSDPEEKLLRPHHEDDIKTCMPILMHLIYACRH